MNHPFPKSLLLVALLCVDCTPLWAAPTVSNVRVSQRPGTNLVDVYYDLSGVGQGGASVSVELSDNGGTSYGLPISSLSGHVGGGVANGTNRHLVWDAGADRPSAYSTTMRLRLAAVVTPLVPDGFVLIPAGAFTMGDQSDPLLGDPSELPVHSVSVSAFYMAKHEVTKELWDRVRAWGLSNGYTDLAVGNGSSASKGVNHPVHTITWFDAVQWCNARSQEEGLTPCYTVAGVTYKTGQNSTVACNWSANGYRLPTEAEWEKAARGGMVGKNFPWGTDTISHGLANYYSEALHSYDISPTRRYHPSYAVGSVPYSSPVGSFAPNGYGLYDMAGNMWEWCWDWYGASYVSASPTSDPRGPASGSYRVFRGGGWSYPETGCRAAYRRNDTPAPPQISIGFRIARSSAP